VIQNYYSKIFTLVYYLVQDRYLAEDITQEAFVIAMEKYHQLRDLNKFLPWLARIATNLAKTHLKRKLRTVPLSDMEAAVSSSMTDTSYSNTAEHLDADTFVKNALPRLSLQEQQIVILRYYMDMTEKDIAFSLGISIGSVKKQLFRARSKLMLEYRVWSGKDGDSQ
jgi:RNA polymerase sigma-70 factor (ECF subfamily)